MIKEDGGVIIVHHIVRTMARMGFLQQEFTLCRSVPPAEPEEDIVLGEGLDDGPRNRGGRSGER
jgi:hypothetical protein